jgi:NADPH-dependent glutamate synthase beta subunit-like oxidoreductase
MFSAGDIRHGQSLVAWAIREGRRSAGADGLVLMETRNLPGVTVIIRESG